MLPRLRALVMISALLAATPPMVGAYVLAQRLRSPLAGVLQTRYHRLLLKTIGVRVRVSGRPVDDRPLMIAANHSSWVDILALGSVMPLAFIAKSEVADWPVFGTFAKLQRTVFIDRQRRGQTREQAEEIARRLAGGEAIVLFAEGTTSDGNRVETFRSSLFGAAKAAIDGGEHAEVVVQPVAIAYTHLHGLPLGRIWRPLVAWMGDEEMVPHLRSILREAAFDLTVRFGEPITFGASTDRKRLAQTVEQAVRAMLSQELLGR